MASYWLNQSRDDPKSRSDQIIRQIKVDDRTKSTESIHDIPREEGDVINLRNPTKDKRAFRRMLTSADQTIQPRPQVYPVKGPLTYKKAAFLTSLVH